MLHLGKNPKKIFAKFCELFNVSTLIQHFRRYLRNSGKMSSNSEQNSMTLFQTWVKFAEMLRSERCKKHVTLVDLVKSFPTHIYLQKLASIQPRTRPWQILQDEPRKTSRWLERGRYSKTSHVKEVVSWSVADTPRRAT